MAALGLRASARAGTQPQLVKSQAEPSPATAQRRFFFFLTKAGVGPRGLEEEVGPARSTAAPPTPAPLLPLPEGSSPEGGAARSLLFVQVSAEVSPSLRELSQLLRNSLFPSSPRKPPSLCSSSCHVSLPDVRTVLCRSFFFFGLSHEHVCLLRTGANSVRAPTALRLSKDTVPVSLV